MDAAILTAVGFDVVVVEPSAGMGAVARSRGGHVVQAGAADLASVAGLFDGALSNFGALNCVADLTDFATGLHGRLRPGAPALLVVMGPFAVAESCLLAARGRFGTLVTRRRASLPLGVGQVGVTWWTVPALEAGMKGFALEHVEALGGVHPPPDLCPGGPRLRTWDARLARLPLLRHLGDHTLCVFRRVP